MKGRFIILVMITTIALLVCVTGGLAQPLNLEEKINLEDIPVYNPCTAETVKPDGTLHLNGRLLLDFAGGFHLKLHANSHLVGEGINSGTEYIANVTYNWQLNGKFLPFETTKILTASLISQGKEPNL